MAVATTDVLIKIAELATEHLHEFFGTGDAQTEAKNQLIAELDLQPSWGDIPDTYTPGARVDWITLLKLFEDARQTGGRMDHQNLEQRFDEWFLRLDDYHKEELLKAIARGAG